LQKRGGSEKRIKLVIAPAQVFRVGRIPARIARKFVHFGEGSDKKLELATIPCH
jgi:hypothetical protein